MTTLRAGHLVSRALAGFAVLTAVVAAAGNVTAADITFYNGTATWDDSQSITGKVVVGINGNTDLTLGSTAHYTATGGFELASAWYGATYHAKLTVQGTLGSTGVRGPLVVGRYGPPSAELVIDGGSIYGTAVTLGRSTGVVTVSMNDGLLDVTGGASTFSDNVNVSISQSGGTMNWSTAGTANVLLGNRAGGSTTYTVSGGTSNFGAGLVVGNAAASGSSALLAMDGSGGAVHVAGTLTLDAPGTLAFTLDGSGNHVSTIDVGSAVFQSGQIDLALDGFTPTPNQVFDLVAATTSLTGFNTLTLASGDEANWTLLLSGDGKTLQAVYTPVQATLSYSYGTTNTKYRYRPLNITASYGANTVWSMSLWVPQEGYAQTAHDYWLAGEIASFKDVLYGGTPFDYSPEAASSGSLGLMRMGAMQGSFLDGTGVNDHSGQTSGCYEFTKTYTIQTGVVATLTVRINAPIMGSGTDHVTTIDGTYTISNTSGATYDLTYTSGTAGCGSLGLSHGGLTSWAFVNPTASTTGVNSHVTDVTDGHPLYLVHDWFGSTATSDRPGFYAKTETKDNAETASRNMRPGMTFELMAEAMDFYYTDNTNTMRGSTTVNSSKGVWCSLSSQPGVFGQGAVLPTGEQVTMNWTGLISTVPQTVPPHAVAGGTSVVADIDDDGYADVALNATDSYDPDGSIASYLWTEGETTLGTGATLEVALARGTHQVVLTVTDNEGRTSSQMFTVLVDGARFYVDFDGGNDNNDGMSAEHPWKHCPGDANATGNAAARTLVPGSVVYFKGGVKYRGRIDCNWSGETDLPITYDGNTAGTFGTGMAIIDGSETLSGWTQCQSAEEALSNPNWANIWYAYAPAGTDANTSNLYQFSTVSETENMCWLAQDPNQSDPFYMDDTTQFYSIPCQDVTTTSITDSTRLTQSDPDYWVGACVMVWLQGNLVAARSITGFDPSTDTITFASTTAPYTDRDELYALYNHISLLDQAGEYYFNDTAEADGTHKVYLWPPAGNPNTNSVSISVPAARTRAFYVGNKSHLVFDGFTMQKFAGAGEGGGAGIATVSSATPSTDLTVENNTFQYMRRDYRQGNGFGGINLLGSCMTIRNNVFRELPVTNAMQLTATDSIIQDNYIWKPGRHGMWMTFYDTQIVGNTILEVGGSHANGIAVFNGSSNVQVLGNTVICRKSVAISTGDSDDITVAYNFMSRSDAGRAYADYNGCTNLKVHNNTILCGGVDYPAIRNDSGGELKNNIANTNEYSGPPSLIPDANGNLFISHAMESTVFADPATGDYHLKTGSPAIDAGLDLNYEYDIEGTSVPQGDDPDSGCFEYVP